MTRRQKETLGAAIKIVIGLLFVIPIFLGIIYSFKTNSAIAKGDFGLFSGNWTLDNYKYVFQNIPVLTYFLNTAIYVCTKIPCQVLLASFAAYAFSYFEFKGKDFIFTVFLTSMMIPGEVTIVTKFLMVQEMGLLDTRLGVIITGLVGAGSIFLLRQTMKGIPRELWEAAMMDGCSEMRYFWRIILPLCKSIIASMAITGFIGIYNSYFWPLLVLTKKELFPVQMGMAELIGEGGHSYGTVLSAATVNMIIPLIVYIFCQKYIVAGLTAGAVKS